MGKELRLRKFRDVTRNVKGNAPTERKKLKVGKIRHQKLKPTPINSYSSNSGAEAKGQGNETDLPRPVQTNTILPVPER